MTPEDKKQMDEAKISKTMKKLDPILDIRNPNIYSIMGLFQKRSNVQLQMALSIIKKNPDRKDFLREIDRVNISMLIEEKIDKELRVNKKSVINNFIDFVINEYEIDETVFDSPLIETIKSKKELLDFIQNQLEISDIKFVRTGNEIFRDVSGISKVLNDFKAPNSVYENNF